MTGGRRPPGPTPPGQVWLNELPAWNGSEFGVGILNATVNGVFGLVVSINGESVISEHILRTADSMFWRFDVESNEFIADIPTQSGSNWTAQVAELLGVHTGTTIEQASVGHEDVNFRFDAG